MDSFRLTIIVSAFIISSLIAAVVLRIGGRGWGVIVGALATGLVTAAVAWLPQHPVHVGWREACLLGPFAALTLMAATGARQEYMHKRVWRGVYLQRVVSHILGMVGFVLSLIVLVCFWAIPRFG